MVLTSRLCVVHCLPSSIRLKACVVPDAFWSCAERSCNEVLRDPNAIVSAIDTTQTRIGLVLCLTVLTNDLHRWGRDANCPVARLQGWPTKNAPYRKHAT